MEGAASHSRPATAPGPLLEQTLRPEQRLSALALQVIQSLALTQEGVDRLIAEHLARNPALVSQAPRRCRWCAGQLRWGRCSRCDAEPFLWEDPESETDPREWLRQEARALVRAGCEDAVDVVVDHLDPRGLLPGGVETLVGAASLPREQLATALRAVQEAGPPGTGESDALAGLLAQARWHETHGGPPLLVPLLRDQLSTFASDPEAAAKALGVSAEAVQDAVRFLRTRLTPAPLPLDSPLRPAPPDVILRLEDGRLVAEVLRAADLGLRLAPGAADGMSGTSGGERWTAALDEARALLDLLDRRATALQRVATVLADRQHDFVMRGPRWHRPLTRAQVAGALGLHPSTVSRAVRGAVAAVPGGRTMPLADFFGSAVPARDALTEMLRGPEPPATDADAAARLARQGIVVARRTVTKYRHEIERDGGEAAFPRATARRQRGANAGSG